MGFKSSHPATKDAQQSRWVGFARGICPSSACSATADPRLGIAVSGGVDSIALASLCQALAESRPELRLQFKAYVVDHGARDGSDLEALKVTSILRSFGTSSVVCVDGRLN